MTCSLLIAHTFEDADRAAAGPKGWGWWRASDAFGIYEFRRPDRPREVIRWLPDRDGSLQGLQWNTAVYLVEGWRRRNDAGQVGFMLGNGFFKEEDPELPPPRPRQKRDAVLDDVRKTLARLEKTK